MRAFQVRAARHAACALMLAICAPSAAQSTETSTEVYKQHGSGASASLAAYGCDQLSITVNVSDYVERTKSNGVVTVTPAKYIYISASSPNYCDRTMWSLTTQLPGIGGFTMSSSLDGASLVASAPVSVNRCIAGEEGWECASHDELLEVSLTWAATSDFSDSLEVYEENLRGTYVRSRAVGEAREAIVQGTFKLDGQLLETETGIGTLAKGKRRQITITSHGAE